MSELLFLGTGAADWDIKNKAGFFRRNSAALLDGCFMLDCGSHIFDFAESTSNPSLYDDVTDIIITHDHYDHFSKESVLKIAENKKIRVGCCGHIKNLIGEHENIQFTLFSPLHKAQMGNYSVTALLANHHIVIDGDNMAFHYIIETPDGKKLFYGLDGAWFLRPSWQEMLKHRFDIMVFDCTVGDSHDWRIFEHNTIPMLRDMVKEINDRKMLTDNGKLIASHLARTLHVPHEETSEILDKIGMMTAFDGMEITF